MNEDVHARSPTPTKSKRGPGILSYLKHFDVYTKVEEDYRVQTSSGALCKHSIDHFFDHFLNCGVSLNFANVFSEHFRLGADGGSYFGRDE